MKRTLFSAHYNCMKDPFNLIARVETGDNPDHLTDNGVLLLQGGEDISPSIYNKPNNSYCRADQKPSVRDVKEMKLVERAVKMGLPIIGICRGAQLLCAMDGGYLIQHIEGHTTGGHEIMDRRTKQVVHTNSCHHQMMAPNKYNNILAADVTRKINAYTEHDKQFQVSIVPEVVYFPNLNAIGIQGHPEWVPNSAFAAYCKGLIKEFLIKD